MLSNEYIYIYIQNRIYENKWAANISRIIQIYFQNPKQQKGKNK